ncbi:unnamed protein product [Cochlearia groenlandica]
MGYVRKIEEEDEEDEDSSSSSLNESMLKATMCMIESKVHVHVNDGSVFSGIFYTASFDDGFGIVLKNAEITKKGTCKSNVASGSVVETLVVLSSNIVQIVAEGVSLPSIFTGNNEGESVGAATETLPSELRLCADKKSKKFRNEGKGNSRRRQAGAKILKRSEQTPEVHQENNVDIQSSSSRLNSMSERVKPVEEEKLMPEPFSNGFQISAERPFSTDKSSSSTNADETSELSQGLVASSNASVPIQVVEKAKEFKLNPEAKIFSPSYPKRVSPSPAGMPDVGNNACVPKNTPMLPAPGALYPEVGNNAYIPQASPPPKFVPYGNLTAGNAVGGFQFPQQMIGPTVSMAQPQRFTSQYQPLQASPMFINPNPPQVMATRIGQFVYIQPVSQNLVQVTPPLPPMLSRPLPTANHVQYLKHQGKYSTGQPLQLCVSQPFMAGAMQPYGVSPQFPITQPPFPTNQPMAVSVPNGFFGTKFP